MNENIVRFNLDEESMACLLNMCALEKKTPSEIIHDLIQNSANKFMPQ